MKDQRAEEHWNAHDALQKAESFLKEKLETSPGTDISLQYAILFLLLNDPERAEHHLQSVSSTDPNLPEVWLYLGIANIQKSNTHEAVLCFQRAVSLAPTDLTARSYLAEALRLNSELGLAEAEYKKLLEITDRHIESHVGLGSLYETLGKNAADYNQALYYYGTALQIADSRNISRRLTNKEIAALHYARGNTCIKLYKIPEARVSQGKELLKQALGHFKKCVARDPNPWAKEAVAVLEKRLGTVSFRSVMEEFGPLVMAALAGLIFLGTQVYALIGIVNDSPMSIVSYGFLTFSAIILLGSGFYLPRILPLPIGGLDFPQSRDSIVSPSVPWAASMIDQS